MEAQHCCVCSVGVDDIDMIPLEMVISRNPFGDKIRVFPDTDIFLGVFIYLVRFMMWILSGHWKCIFGEHSQLQIQLQLPLWPRTGLTGNHIQSDGSFPGWTWRKFENHWWPIEIFFFFLTPSWLTFMSFSLYSFFFFIIFPSIVSSFTTWEMTASASLLVNCFMAKHLWTI